MGLLSPALLAELKKPAPEVYFVLEIDDGSGGLLRASAENVGSRTRGLYRKLITRWGTYTRTLSNWRTGLQAARLSVEMDNTGGQLVLEFGRDWRGRAATGLLMSPNVDAADYLTWFVGVVDDTPRQGEGFTVEMRQDDDALAAKVPKAPIRSNTFSGLPTKGEASGNAVPYVIGTMDSTGLAALGLVPCPYVNGVLFQYLETLGWWQNVVRVYSDNELKIPGAGVDGEYSLVQDLSGDGRKVTRVQFLADQVGKQIVVDTQDVTSPEGPAACLAQVLSDLVYGDYHTEHPDASAHPINATALAELDSGFLVPLRLGRSYYVPAGRVDGKTIIKHFCDSYEVHACWGLDGKLTIRPWDNRTQGNSVYLGPGAPDVTLAAMPVITPDVMLSKPKFSRDPEAAVNSLLGKAGLRPSDSTWLDQRTVLTKRSTDKLRAAEIEMPWLPPSGASIGSVAYLRPDSTTNNTGWTAVGAGSAHAAVAQDPLVAASSAQYVTTAASADLRFGLQSMPDLIAVQSVTIWYEALADGTVLSGDDDTLVSYLWIGGIQYILFTLVGGGVAPYQRYWGGSAVVNPNTTLQFTQADLNALEVGFGWDPQTTVGKSMAIRIAWVQVAYTASADVSPAHLSVTSRRANRYRNAPESISADLPLRFMDADLGELVAYADPREGWANTVAGRRICRRTSWVLNPDKKVFTPTDEDVSRQQSTLWIYGKAGVGVDGASAAGDGVVLMTHGAVVEVVRGSKKQMDAPAGEDVQECGPSVQILENCLPADRYGTLIEPQSTNLILDSVFSRGGIGTPTSWTLTSGTATTDATVGEQLFLDDAVTLQSYLLTGDGATITRITASTTSSISANSKVFVSTARKGSSATAGDGLFWRLVRNFDGKYWRESDATWQVGATDNELPAVTSWTRWDAISKMIDVGASATTLTLSYSLPVVGTAARTVRIGHAQIEVGRQATSMIPTYAATVTRASDAIRISNDEDSATYKLLPEDHGCIKKRARVMFNDADLEASGRRYLWRLMFDANNSLACYYLKSTGWVAEAVKVDGTGPIVITLGVNDFIPYTEQISGANSATLAAGSYANIAALAAQVQSAFNASFSDQAFTVTVSGGKLRIARASQTFTLDWTSSVTQPQAADTAATLGWAGADVAATLASVADDVPETSGVAYTATIQSADRAPLREDIVTVGARWTSNDATGELGLPTGTLSIALSDHNGDVSSADITVGAPPTFAAASWFEWGYDASTAGREFGGYFEEVRQSPLCFEDEELVS
jgi:hypothetical protein